MLRETDVHVLLANETLFYSNTLYDSILHQSLSQGNVATGVSGNLPSNVVCSPGMPPLRFDMMSPLRKTFRLS